MGLELFIDPLLHEFLLQFLEQEIKDVFARHQALGCNLKTALILAEC